MMSSLPDGLKAIREAGYASATQVLSSLSFKECKKRMWCGPLIDKSGVQHEVKLDFPPEFPDKLPIVKLVFKKPQELVAHVDRFGTVCIAADSGLLIDATRPEAVVREVLGRARDVLSLQGAEREGEILREVTSYWVDSAGEVYSLCQPDRPSGLATQVELAMVSAPLLVADTRETITKWAQNCGWRFGRPREAYFLRLSSQMVPPAYEQILTFDQLKDALSRVMPGSEISALETWIKRSGVPATVLLSMPMPDSERRAILGLRVLPPSANVLADAQRGFRDGRVPSGLLFSRADYVNTARISVHRLDPEYMLRRGGINVDLRSKRVAVVGCGAIGSHVAQALAQSGVGTLRLVDDEKLECGNIHRHFLGARFINEPKPRGLMARLTEDYPLLTVATYEQTVEDLLRDSPEAILNNDVVVFALGDETLERRLNGMLRGRIPLVHTWIEPHGIAGHVLVSALPMQRGCYGCLFERDDTGALFNAANLTKSGQVLQQTLDGCLGTFTPYGAMDAQIAAVHAARAVVRILRGGQAENSLFSWMGNKTEFLAQGLKLSNRAHQFQEWSSSLNSTFARSDCEFCNVRSDV